MPDDEGSQPPAIPPAPQAPAVPPPPGEWPAGGPAVPAPSAVPQPYPMAPPYRPPSTNGFAVASLVLGIVWLWGVASILALILGFIARAKIRRSGGWQSGDGLAIAGIVLGIIGIVGLLVLIIVTVSRANFTY